MGNSLLDQLKKSGLVNEQQAKTVRKSKQKQAKQQRQNADVSAQAEGKQLALEEQAKKLERDKALNKERLLEQQKREQLAQIKQLIEEHNVVRAEGEIRFNFADAGKVKRLYMEETQQRQLSDGLLAIVKFDDHYHLVPSTVAKKIEQRDASAVIFMADANAAADDDDPYADYKVPDDLNW